MHFMADPSHLLKNWKGMLQNNDIIISEEFQKAYNLPSNKVTLDHFKAVTDYQATSILQPAPKLSTDTQSHYGKMKVSPAMHFWSHKTSQAMRFMVSAQSYPEELLTSAWFVEKICKWFSLVCSRKPVESLSLFDEQKYEENIGFLLEFVELMKQIQIINKKDKKVAWKPVQTGSILTTLSILDVHKILLEAGLKFVITAHLGSDSMENIFSMARSVASNPTPTARDMKYILRHISFSQFLLEVKSSSYNYDDGGDFLVEFLDKTAVKEIEQELCNVEDEFIPQFISNLHLAPQLSLLEKNCLYWVSGYIISRIQRYDHHCETCISQLKVNSSHYVNDEINKLVTIGDYNGDCLIHCCPLYF